MNVIDYLNISKHINECPNCGSDLLGKGYGSLRVDENIIERKCKCGFNFKFDVSNGVKIKQIKQAIKNALDLI